MPVPTKQSKGVSVGASIARPLPRCDSYKQTSDARPYNKAFETPGYAGGFLVDEVGLKRYNRAKLR